MSFSSDIKKFCDKTNTRTEEFARAVKLSLFSSIISDTRVKTGRLRGNWQTSTGSPKFTQIERLDLSGSAAKQEVLNNITAFGVDYMTNNLPYAAVWEERDGMVAKNMVRLKRTVKEAAANA
jgi:hypothetical protein